MRRKGMILLLSAVLVLAGACGQADAPQSDEQTETAAEASAGETDFSKMKADSRGLLR